MIVMLIQILLKCWRSTINYQAVWFFLPSTENEVFQLKNLPKSLANGEKVIFGLTLVQKIDPQSQTILFFCFQMSLFQVDFVTLLLAGLVSLLILIFGIIWSNRRRNTCNSLKFNLPSLFYWSLTYQPHYAIVGPIM